MSVPLPILDPIFMNESMFECRQLLIDFLDVFHRAQESPAWALVVWGPVWLWQVRKMWDMRQVRGAGMFCVDVYFRIKDPELSLLFVHFPLSLLLLLNPCRQPPNARLHRLAEATLAPDLCIGRVHWRCELGIRLFAVLAKDLLQLVTRVTDGTMNPLLEPAFLLRVPQKMPQKQLSLALLVVVLDAGVLEGFDGGTEGRKFGRDSVRGRQFLNPDEVVSHAKEMRATVHTYRDMPLVRTHNVLC